MRRQSKALSAITSSSEPPNGHEIAAQEATQAGLAYRVVGLVCERSTFQIPGNHHDFRSRFLEMRGGLARLGLTNIDICGL